MIPRILVPGRVLPAGRAGRHAAVAAGVRYLEAIDRAGGLGLVLAPTELSADAAVAVLAGMSGLLLTGGADVDPARYGEDPSPHTYGVDPVRDACEVALADAATRLGLPVLGICRGLQLLNVARGGTLCQHLDDGTTLPRRPPAFPAPAPGTNGPLVEVGVAAGSRLAAAVGQPSVLGAHSHHQAIDRLGDGLVVTGTAADGVVEAIEPADPTASWLLAVQWHPEDTAEHDPANQRLFDAFIEAAR